MYALFKKSLEPMRNALREKEDEVKRLTLQYLEAQYAHFFETVPLYRIFMQFDIFLHFVIGTKHLWQQCARRTRIWHCCR